MICRGGKPDFFFDTNAAYQSLVQSRQVRSVDVPPAPVDCELSSWSSWMACDPCQKKRVRSQALGEHYISGQGWEVKKETHLQHLAEVLMVVTGHSLAFKIQAVGVTLLSLCFPKQQAGAPVGITMFSTQLSLPRPASDLLFLSAIHGIAREATTRLHWTKSFPK